VKAEREGYGVQETQLLTLALLLAALVHHWLRVYDRQHRRDGAERRRREYERNKSRERIVRELRDVHRLSAREPDGGAFEVAASPRGERAPVGDRPTS
jgi:hypothetical protein